MNAIVRETVCPLLAEPSWESTLVDEVLYGMVVELLESPAPGWYRVRTHYRYEGIAPASALLAEPAQISAWQDLPKRVVLEKNFCDVLNRPKVQGWRMETLPRGGVIAVEGEAENGWQKVRLADGRTGFSQASLLSPFYDAPCCAEETSLRKALVRCAMLYAGTHYRWGGKSPMGIDCSGLVSMAYLLCGIRIYRDASIVDGFPIHAISREHMRPGDLLFFPGHVAMYLGEGRYCHSTGRAGDDGFAVNSLYPGDPDYRADLAGKITAIGSYF